MSRTSAQSLVLQLGRDQLIAEISAAAARELAATACFNWAAIS